MCHTRLGTVERSLISEVPVLPSFLAREHTVAPPGFNRWLIPPAALAVHLCIGQVYATSVYKTALVQHFDTSLTWRGYSGILKGSTYDSRQGATHERCLSLMG